MTTYADKVQKLVSKVKKSKNDKQLVWLLERGVEFDGDIYKTEKQFEAKYKNKKRVMPYLAIGEFIKTSDMVRIVPVEAPKNYTADIKLRKGKATDPTLPVVVEKTNLEDDYPFLTKELAGILKISVSKLVAVVGKLGLKGDQKYHQELRTSKNSCVHRYSNSANSKIEAELAE